MAVKRNRREDGRATVRLIIWKIHTGSDGSDVREMNVELTNELRGYGQPTHI